MNDRKTSLEIQSFIIFDPTLGDDENEEEKKILYYYPRTIPIDQQTKTIGLCEAMCNFAREFTNSPCQYIHTMKTRIVLHRLENNISMILTIKIPQCPDNSILETSSPDHKKIDPDGYLDEDIQNSICESIITHCHQMFFLFMGPPSLIVENSGLDSLREKLSKFFDRYIAHGMFDNYQLTDVLTGVQYLVVDKEVCSNVESVIHKLESKFPDIFCSMMLFNNNLISSTVDKADLGILYRYLTTTLLAKYNINESFNSVFTTKNMGRFYTPSQSIDSQSLPKIFFGTNNYVKGECSSIKECFILVYRVLQANFVLFVEQSAIINEKFRDSIHEYVGPQLTYLIQCLGKVNVKLSHNVPDNPHRYIYWNPDTLSLKCTLFPIRQLKSDFAPLIPLDTIRLMGDIKEELDRNDQVKEMAVKLDSDSWVSCVKDNKRELLVAINKRNFSLVDVSREMKQVCSRDFPDIFRLDND